MPQFCSCKRIIVIPLCWSPVAQLMPDSASAASANTRLVREMKAVFKLDVVIARQWFARVLARSDGQRNAAVCIRVWNLPRAASEFVGMAVSRSTERRALLCVIYTLAEQCSALRERFWGKTPLRSEGSFLSQGSSI